MEYITYLLIKDPNWIFSSVPVSFKWIFRPFPKSHHSSTTYCISPYEPVHVCIRYDAGGLD